MAMRSIDKLRLFDMIKSPEVYSGLPEGLIDLPVPGKIKIAGKIYKVPDTREEFADSICYGQRIYLARKEDNDFDMIIRHVGGYYLNGYREETKVLKLIKKVVTCKAKEIYPVALHLVNLLSEVVQNEQKLLHREPTKLELAAGIEKLDVYAELNVLDFLRDAMKITIREVMETPYNECLVRLMNAKEIMDYQERYYKLQNEELELKTKKR